MDTETTNPVEGEAMPETEVIEDAAEEVVSDDASEDWMESDGESDNPEGDEPEEESQSSPDDELVEFEDNGRKVKVPKWAKDRMLMHSDYTKKTQETAEKQRQLTQMIEQRENVSVQEQQAQFNIQMLNMQLAQADQAIQQAQTTDEIAFVTQHRSQIEAQLRGASQAHENLKSQREAFDAQQRQQQLQQGIETLKTAIPDFGPDKAQAIQRAAIETYGFTQDEMSQVMDPREVRVLHDAAQWAQHQASQKKTKNIAQGQKSAPINTVKAKSGRQGVKANTDDFAAFEKMADAKLRA